jgi:hypothetical protein
MKIDVLTSTTTTAIKVVTMIIIFHFHQRCNRQLLRLTAHSPHSTTTTADDDDVAVVENQYQLLS